MPRPLSAAQKATCQQNAQRSTGPRTAAGKAKARLNAVTHGLTAKLPVLPFESAADFAVLKDGFLHDFAPQNTYQTFLVTQLATHAWRILRSQQVEIGLQEILLKKLIHDLQGQGLDTQNALAESPYAGLALTLQPDPTDPHNHLLRNFFRYTRQIQSDFHRTHRALKSAESTTPGFVSSALPTNENTASPPARQSNQQCPPTPKLQSSNSPTSTASTKTSVPSTASLSPSPPANSSPSSAAAAAENPPSST